jgi:hypothetical protein
MHHVHNSTAPHIERILKYLKIVFIGENMWSIIFPRGSKMVLYNGCSHAIHLFVFKVTTLDKRLSSKYIKHYTAIPVT